MRHTLFSWDLFKKAPIIGIVRNLAVEDVIQILPIYRNAGLTTIEITMNTAGAEDLIRYAVAQEQAGLNIGAGTVCTEPELERALAAGAQFIVTPIINENVIRTCVARNIPIFPGAFTPSEIYKAWSLGASMVKVFPAASLGYSYLKEVKGPLNQIKLVPTGGVSLANMTDFLKAGADGLGIGGQIFDTKLIQQKNWDGLQQHFMQFVNQLTASST
ncbi:bifunctional 4-hydroxy-2-oxoglutarate aldolase/2-dehydro-3-deoxy-phosphogluconate aldolase [Larkinella sp. C7]|jgi:2-dehydro-3-deoxyphosphogluconate aldolase/(4S)-4-hydroxy-2-oxoglutarate aldolase|uniref:bifunctional 4-hydroxy-2-oxoglutarate aldolase/2-dehydro-3-deoxy-phosphogluconate aldolase n=1 Tax=Larkinella sp. C7 TaxID=2576607 RepID=UPI0011112DC6|nr:bifunctional 4-hydroxy-2-oxoglutarate aldolase/2-dehydro-3-deoxy-phosphogluconate aldolase [Larkinella sp. C7]